MAKKNPLIRKTPTMTGPSKVGHKSAGILDDFAVRKNMATKEGTIEKVPVNHSDIVNKKYVDNVAIGSEVTLYLSDTVSDIGTYFDLKPSPTGEAESNANVVAAADDTLIKSFASISGCACVSAIALLVQGVYETHLHAESTKTGCQIYAELYKRTVLGAETLISTSETTDNLSVGSSSSYVIHFTVTDDIAWIATDRVVIKYYANPGIGANPTVTMYMEGDTASRVTLKTTAFNRLHSSLGNLAYADAAHTGFAEALGADDNYVTDAEKIVIGNTSGTNTGDQNSHDALDDVSADDHHPQSHNAASHSDIASSGADIDDAVAKKHTAGTDPNDHVQGTDPNDHASGSDDQISSDFTHNDLGGIDAGDINHLTDAQVGALHTAGTDPNDHLESHTVASHNDTTATGTELDTLTDGSNADALHDHTEASVIVTHASTTGRTVNDHHNELHQPSHSNGQSDALSHDNLTSGTIASHDTTATGTELNTLTNNLMADALHRHSELSASDGTPDPALIVDATGQVGIGTATPTSLDAGKTVEVSDAVGSEIILTRADTSVQVGDLVAGFAGKNADTTGAEPHYAGMKVIAVSPSGAMDLDFYGGAAAYEVGTTPHLKINSAGDVDVVNDFTAGTIQADDGLTDDFVIANGDTVHVVGGIITGITPA